MEATQKTRLGAYPLFLTADTFISFAVGLFGPFWIIYAQKFDSSMEAFGFAVGLKIFAFSLVAYYAGKLSDKTGRKILMICGRLASGLIILAYTQIATLTQLYALQVLFGIVGAIDATATAAFLGDITQKVSRGRDMGKLSAVTGSAGAIAMMVGGVTVGKFGIEVVFYAVAALFCVSPLILLFVKENNNEG